MVATDPLVKLQDVIFSGRKSAPDFQIYWGYLLLAVSFILYGIGEFVDINSINDDFTVFALHYMLAIGYAILLLFNSSMGVVKSWRREHIHKTVIALNLFLISAYALNRKLPVFDESTSWLCYYLVACSIVLLSFSYFEALPPWVNKIQYGMLGSALVLYVYLSVYCAGFYAIGTIGLILLGIGGHILVPLFLVIACFMLIRHSRSPGAPSYAWLIAGFSMTIVLVGAFAATWSRRIEAISRINNVSVLNTDKDLPAWVRIAATLEDDWITERLLKSDLVYRSGDPTRWALFPDIGTWDEPRRHDPLVFISTLFRRVTLSMDERINILEATRDRHRAHDRLWSGDNLLTTQVVTDADIYPDLRLAYTERYFTIRNDRHTSRWRTREEAIYTFQLPEGSVVTSLSLWINGREEKAILTSKQKADKAYTTIVGQEARDPSVIHWQEGNTVVVRVFPCTPSEERRFKIGITSPLPEVNGRTVYEGISFRGPDAHDAIETVRVRFMGNPGELKVPDALQQNEKGEYFGEQRFNEGWSISFQSTPVGQNQFTFNGSVYSIKPLPLTFEKRDFRMIYLDLNKSWTSDELEQLRPLLKSRSLYVYGDGSFVQLTESNWSDITRTMMTHNFSLFPFHRLEGVEEALVISKGQELSPFLADFKNSPFADRVAEFFASHQKVHLYNISSVASTYIRSLRELRALNYASGDVGELLDLLQKHEYPVVSEDEHQIVLHDAKLLITQNAAVGKKRDNAPDHLARLFAYNDIMRQVGAQFFADDFINVSLVEEATAAYVVSPVSSLIVLETKEDYERFGINDSNNSLHNASRQSSGAVPEPHEWALMIVFGLLVLICIRTHGRNKAMASR